MKRAIVKTLLKSIVLGLSILFATVVLGFAAFSRVITVDDFFNAGVFGSLYMLTLSCIAISISYFVGKSIGSDQGSGLISFISVIGLALFLGFAAGLVGPGSFDCDAYGRLCDSEFSAESVSQSQKERFYDSSMVFFLVLIPGFWGIRKGSREINLTTVSGNNDG